MDTNILVALISAVASIISALIAARGQGKRKQVEEVGPTKVIVEKRLLSPGMAGGPVDHRCFVRLLFHRQPEATNHIFSSTSNDDNVRNCCRRSVYSPPGTSRSPMHLLHTVWTDARSLAMKERKRRTLQHLFLMRVYRYCVV
jgi:hypothetical protein